MEPFSGWEYALVTSSRDPDLLDATADRLLAEAGAAFAASVDVASTIAVLSQRVVPAIADVCVVFALRDDRSVGVMALESTTPHVRQALQAFDKHYPVDNTPWHPIWTPLNHGTTVLIEDVGQIVHVSEALASLALETGTTSILMVPLQARGSVLGAIGLGTRLDRPRFNTSSVVLMERVAQLAALALDNARLLAAEQRARDEAERARQAAERASQAKSDFLAMMSHELRTPLNAIAGYAELLELGLKGPVTVEQVADLQRIRRAQKHLLSLINSVLTFVRLDAGRVTYDIANVPVDACLGSMHSLIAPLLQARNQRYAYRSSAPLATLRADAEKVQQILLNLLDNSIKFTPEGGAISISATLSGDMVHITVADTGPGVEVARLEEIFEPFVQAGSAAERRQGVGLGLPISRELARGMGGDLVAHRPVMGGGTFVLTLPRGPDRASDAR